MGAPVNALSREPLAGPRLTGFVSLLLVGMVALLLAWAGWSADGLRLVVRATARTSLALFLLVFVTSALRRRWPTAATRWLLTNRRYLGLSFAASHGLHLLALVALGASFPAIFAARVQLPTLLVGGLGFVVVAALAATSSDRAVRWLGARRWSRLHTAGIYYLWGVFTLTYGARNVPCTLLLVAALVLRLRTRR